MSNLTLGARLRQHRETLGFTIQQVEYLTGIDSAFMALLEDDKISKPAPYILKELAYLYKERVISFLGEECEKEAAYQTISKEDQKTIDAIKLVSQKERTPEEAQQFLIDAGIEPAISKEEVKEEIIDRYLDQFWNGEIFDVDAVSAAMTEYTDLQTAALREENERLKAENAELMGSISGIANWSGEMCGWPDAGFRAKGTAQSILSKHKP